jgi:5-hydroxyisourate hydrolase
MTLSTHVLDATTGRPAVGVGVLLETYRDGAWAEVASGLTDDDGRLKQWLPDHLPGVGTHRLLFDTGAYFTRAGVTGFYPAVTITFVIDQANQHYHVPLLLSPFAYSTYRGS